MPMRDSFATLAIPARHVATSGLLSRVTPRAAGKDEEQSADNRHAGRHSRDRTPFLDQNIAVSGAWDRDAQATQENRPTYDNQRRSEQRRSAHYVRPV
jgi:hypothetical protein